MTIGQKFDEFFDLGKKIELNLPSSVGAAMVEIMPKRRHKATKTFILKK